MRTTYLVALVVDRGFGDRLFDLVTRMHVWIVESSANRAAVDEVWRELVPEYSLERGVTVFKDDGSLDPDSVAAERLGDIEDHHGGSSHDPPLSRLEIHGTDPTPRLTAALREYGFCRFEQFAGGFRATRDASEGPSHGGESAG